MGRPDGAPLIFSSLGIPLTTYGEILLGREGKSHTFAATKERRVMKKGIICVLVSLLFLSSCATYEGQGAVAGGSLGAILGSAIGGIAGGRHGRDVGTLIGAASGAMAGAAIGQQADKKSVVAIPIVTRAVTTRTTVVTTVSPSTHNPRRRCLWKSVMSVSSMPTTTVYCEQGRSVESLSR